MLMTINLGALLRSQRLQEGSLLSIMGETVQQQHTLSINACNCWNDNNEANCQSVILKNLSETRRQTEANHMLCGLIASPQPVARMHKHLEPMHQTQSRGQRDLDTHWLGSR